MKTKIYVRGKNSKSTFDLIQEGDEETLVGSLKEVDGVTNVELLEVDLDCMDWPVGVAVKGEYDPSRLQQAVCSHGYNITRVEIEREN